MGFLINQIIPKIPTPHKVFDTMFAPTVTKCVLVAALCLSCVAAASDATVAASDSSSEDEPIVLTEEFKAEFRSTYDDVLDKKLQGACGLTKAEYIEKRISFFETGPFTSLETVEHWYGGLKGELCDKNAFANTFYEFACPDSPKRTTPIFPN